MDTKGISSDHLYIHQAEAINHLYASSAEPSTSKTSARAVVLTTPTSSGKSLVYQLPMLLEAFREISSPIHHEEHTALGGGRKFDCRGLYIFPTKALANDQKRSLAQLVHGCGEESGMGGFKVRLDR
jgi:DEAD/DEAH box helicase domain-containing protein